MIRLLQSNEVPLMVEGGKLFFGEGKLPGGFKPEVFCDRWSELIRSGVGKAFALFGADGAINGALGAIFFPDIFNGDPVAIESFWYCLPQHRGHGLMLLNKFIDDARESGCKRISMIHLEELQPEALKALYERKGFRKVETGYVMEFSTQKEYLCR